MNHLKLAENIANHRKRCRVTQEELADFVGVTKASVSKWETGATMPDIGVLPQLAVFFDISVDELLGYEAQLERKQIGYYYRQLAGDFASQPFEQVMEKCEELVKKYYCCYEFLEHMAALYINHAALAGDEERQRNVLSRAEALLKRILDNSREVVRCENAAGLLAVVQLYTGRAGEAAKTFAGWLDPNRLGDTGGILTMACLQLGDYDRAELAIQVGMYRSVLNLVGESVKMLMLPGLEPKRVEETLARTDALLAAWRLESLHPNQAGQYHYQAARVLCVCPGESEEMEEKIFFRIRKYCEAVKRLLQGGIFLHGDEYFSRLDQWLEGMVVRDHLRMESLVRDSVADSLRIPEFERLDQTRLQRLIDEINEMSARGGTENAEDRTSDKTV